MKIEPLDNRFQLTIFEENEAAATPGGSLLFGNLES